VVLVEILILILAVVFGPAMIYRAATGRDLWPVLVDAWAEIAPYIEVATWAAGRLLAPAVPRQRPALLCRSDALNGSDDWQPTPSADVPNVPAQPAQTLPPGSRADVIRLLVANDWTVGQIRGLIKGDNGMIGQEIEQARTVLDAPPPRRTVTINYGRGGEVEL